jgi:NAD(P)H dehydrogenase (quinone)
LTEVAYIRYADVAAVAAGAMLESKHKSGIYEITGPEAFDHYEIASALSTAWSRPIRVEDLSPSNYKRALLARNVPSEIVDVLTTLHLAIGAGEYERVSGDAAVLSGRAFEPVGDFLRRA